MKRKLNWGWLLRMAWRDGKASRSKLVLFMASIVLGIAAVVAIQSFGITLRENIGLQSKSLMGADYIIDTNKPPSDELLKIVDSLQPQASEMSFPSMALFLPQETSKFVQVRGIEGGFPFYGDLVTEPISAADSYREKRQALVDATVMIQLNLKIGDTIKLGSQKLPIGGALKSIPGSSNLFSSIAPPVVVPKDIIEPSGLVQQGSRVDYNYYYKSDNNLDLEAFESRLNPKLRKLDGDIDTHSSTSRRLGRRYENFGKFLNLVGFIALLLGCVGIASSIYIYIKEKLKSVAILKCLGATRKQAFLIYLLQISAMGLIGGVAGTLIGLGMQPLFPIILGDLIPVDIQLVYSFKTVLLGLTLGVTMSLLFALYPLIKTYQVSPLQVIRIQNEERETLKTPLYFVIFGILIFIIAFARWLIGNWKYALIFVVGVIVAFALLVLMANLVMYLVKRFFPKTWSFETRQSLMNLYRPQNQTIILILAIGIGTFLISTLYFTKDMLLAQASIDGQKNSPNMILLDVQSDQMLAVNDKLKGAGLKVLDGIPIVTMRIQSLKGKFVEDIKKDTTATINRWILNHEFRATYRDSLIESESLQKGIWVSRFSGDGIVPISVSDNFAADAQVDVGDHIVFNVQGKLMETEVNSVRLVDWSRLQPNFTVLFPAGVLEKAPQFGVITTKVPNAQESAKIQNELVRDFPNISILDLRQVLSVIEDLLAKISWIINFMAFFSIITGIIVLIGAVRTSKYQRLKESVLLRTIGAKSEQIIKILSLEYILLGAIGTLTGIILSLFGSQLMAWWMFEEPFLPSIFPFLVLFPGITALVWFIGMLNSREVVVSSPLKVLRKEAK
ncbi:ABC transporter permease [Aegicerativicinus sediminis]|uniref:ABC transporter permease n=1 Tax=Aegicerativicinus sediminis TaxID=2893202 RepID=UPI001E3D3ADB|nr:FtsX-like permease family protein [Aegicerativicinus sediminis]